MSRGAVVPLPVRSPLLAAVVLGALAGSPAVALAPPPQRSVLQLDALDLVQAPPVPALALGGEFTVELWVRLYAAASPGEARLFTKRAPGYGVAPAVELWGVSAPARDATRCPNRITKIVKICAHQNTVHTVFTASARSARSIATARTP